MTQLRSFGFGGGAQSVGALVLAAQGKIDYQTFLFCHTGKDSERVETLDYLERYAKPFAAAHGITLIELRYTRKRDGAQPTVYEAMQSGRDIIPMYTAMTTTKNLARRGEPIKLSRTCTADWKAGVVAHWQKVNGATAENPATHALGISVDEFERMRNDSGFAWQKLDYPLVHMRLTRQDLINITNRAGLPTPPKSRCRWCPFQSVASWREYRDTDPDGFQVAVELEATVIARRAAKGQNPAYLTRRLIPLEQAIDGQQATFDDVDDACESGFCMV